MVKKWVIREKNRIIVSRLVENGALGQELKKVRMERDVIEQTLDKFIHQLTGTSESNQIRQNYK